MQNLPPGRASDSEVQLAIVGVVVNLVFSLLMQLESPLFSEVLLVSVAVSALGLILWGLGVRRTGAGMIIAGSVVFIPVGLVAGIGAKRLLEAQRLVELEQLEAAA